MRVFRSDFKRAVCCTEFLLGIGVIVMAGMAGSYEVVSYVRQGLKYNDSMDFMMVFQGILWSDLFLLSIPLVSALAFGAAFSDELHSRFALYSLPRCGWKKYLFSKAIVTVGAGALSVLISIVLLLIYSILISYSGMGKWAQIMPKMGMYAQSILLWGIPLLLSGCLWALVGGLGAAVMKNKYMAYALPFILFYILSEFQSRYYRSLHVLNPKEWALPRHIEMWKGCVLLAAAVIVTGMCYIQVMRKRLRNV